MGAPAPDPRDMNLDAVLAAARKSPPGPVLIAGAGIGGLALAAALAKHGLASHILERRSAFAEDGAGIQIGPNGVRILRALGIDRALQFHFGRPEALRILDAASGRQLGRLPLGDWMERRYSAPYLTLHRADLHGALAAHANAERLVRLSMGAEIIAVRSDEGAVAALAADGRTFSGVALIGADGLWSKVRGLGFSQALPEFSGMTAARAVVAANDPPSGIDFGETHLWLSPQAHVVHYPVRGGREIALVVIRGGGRESDAWANDAPADFLDPVLAMAAPELRMVLSRVPQWKAWALHALPIPPVLARGRVALIGDAAHPVMPYFAQGGVLALEDAMTLARRLSATPGNAPAALAAYAKQRRPRAVRVARASRLNGRSYHASGAFAFARNLVLELTPPERLMARFDWLYGYRDRD